MEVASRLEGIGEYYFSQKLREIEALNKQGKKVINLGIGSPDLPPHPEVIKVLNEEASKPGSHTYQSYKGSPVLRNAISEWYKLWYAVVLDPESEILPLIGSKEGIMHICMTYFSKGDEVLIPNPGYPTYASAIRLSGARPKEYKLKPKKNWNINIEELYKYVDSKKKGLVKGIFLNYPHMPTGVRGDRPLFDELVAFAREKKLLIIHDNPYSFILNDEPLSLLGVEGAKDCVIELNSLSKSHNMAGWRVGMLCGAKERINDVLRFKSNMDSGMFLPVQLAAAKALQLGKVWHDELNKVYYERREKVYRLLRILKCDFTKDQSGLFVWASVPATSKDGFSFSNDLLLQSNVFITPGGIFGNAGDKYVRVSLCSTVEKLDEAIERQNQLLTGNG